VFLTESVWFHPTAVSSVLFSEGRYFPQISLPPYYVIFQRVNIDNVIVTITSYSENHTKHISMTGQSEKFWYYIVWHLKKKKTVKMRSVKFRTKLQNCNRRPLLIIIRLWSLYLLVIYGNISTFMSQVPT